MDDIIKILHLHIEFFRVPEEQFLLCSSVIAYQISSLHLHVIIVQCLQEMEMARKWCCLCMIPI